MKVQVSLWIENDGLKLHYVDLGLRSGRPIVLIHAFPFSSRMWESQIQALKADYRVIACDLRGQGESEAGDGQFTLEFLVDDLIALLDNLGIEQAILCGLSVGGYISLRAIERETARVSALVLCNTKSESDSNESRIGRAVAIRTIKQDGVQSFAKGFLKNAFSPTSISNEPLVNGALEIISKNTPIGLSGLLLALAGRTDTSSFLSKIRVPTLVLVGGQDKITPPDFSRRMHQAIGESELQIVPGAGHLSNIENPKDFNSSLMKFMKRNPQTQS